MKRASFLTMTCSVLLTLLLSWALPHSAQSQYCTPASICSGGDDINHFYTTGATTNITNMNSGCSSGGYILYLPATHTLAAAAGTTFGVNVQTSGFYNQGFTIWIDWNDDGDFMDPGEQVWNSGTTGTQLFTGTITIPPTILPGNLRMRVMGGYDCVPSNPCATCFALGDPYGETEDYTITITGTPPSCLHPTNIIASNITIGTATLDWTENNTATEWEVEYGQTGFSQGNGTSILVNTKPYTLSGLNDTTQYDFYVRSICTQGDTSYWSAPSSFLTPFNLNCPGGGQATVFTEDWELGQGAWSGDIGTGNGQWKINSGTTTSNNTGPDTAHSGSHYIHYEASGTGAPGSATMVSPPIDLTSAVGNALLSFWMHGFGADIPGASLTIGIANSPFGPFNTEYSYTFPNALQTSMSDPYMQELVDLSGYAGQIIYLEITYNNPNSSYFSDLALDLFEVMVCQACANPPNVDLGADSLFICANDSVVLSGGTFDTYEWSTGHTSQSVVIDSSGIGLNSVVIILKATDSIGCANSDTVMITFVAHPITIITGADTMLYSHTTTLDAGVGFTAYLWSTGDTTQTIVVDHSNISIGNNTLEVTVSNEYGCTFTTTKNLFVHNDTGLDEMSDEVSLQIYPNPGKGLFVVEINSLYNDYTLDIKNMNGQTILSDQIKTSSFKKEYDLSHCASGVYILQLYNTYTSHTKKIILNNN